MQLKVSSVSLEVPFLLENCLYYGVFAFVLITVLIWLCALYLSAAYTCLVSFKLNNLPV